MNNFQILTLLSAWNIQNILLLNLEPEPASFAQQTKNPWFLDKTILIKKIFHNLNGTYHLLTYPSKFGKTSNLKMIQSFVELEVDKFGQVKKKWDTKRYKLFTNKSLGLKITQYHDLIRKHLAEYPVIYITFRDIIRPTFEETIKKLTTRIRTCYEKFHWLYEVLKNDSLQETSDEWGYLLRGQMEFWNRTYRSDQCRPVDLQNSLFALSKILCYYLDKKIFVLIDDYDAPLIEAETLAAEITYDRFIVQDYVNGMIQKLFKPTCVDQYIEYGFIVGTTSYFVSSFFRKIKNITYYRFLDNHIFTPFFGFDREEIRVLLHRYRVISPEHNDTGLPPAAFSGYHVANTSRRMYNPHFYLKNFDENNQNQKPLNMIEKDFLISIMRNTRIRECLLQLLDSRLIRFKLLPHITVCDFRKLFKFANGTENENDLDFDFDIFYTLLFEIGYLSYTKLEDVFIVPKEISNVFTT